MTNVDFDEIRAWPFVEARRIVDRLKKGSVKGEKITLATGYGPSGLPHIGTFGEVVRTSMVKNALQEMVDFPVEILCFSDDMDGLRKVPDNIPKREMVGKYLDYPLTSVPDPFEEYASFGESNNSKLKIFLDSFKFEYTFKSSTDCYKSGLFDEMLCMVLEKYDEIMDIMLPTLGKINTSRKDNYSPFLPISPKTGKVLQTSILKRDVSRGTIVFADETGDEVEIFVGGGNCKLQWKVDWAMRWAAFPVDYEMYGKDLIPSADLSAKICKVLGGIPPERFVYELFLDHEGQKISKSKGNGISIEDWLECASKETLAFFMYKKPKTAKRLYYDIIPKTVEEYDSGLVSYQDQGEKEKYENPLHYIHYGKNPPKPNMLVSFSMLINLVLVTSAESKDIVWYFVKKHCPDASPSVNPDLDRAIGYAINFCRKYHFQNRKFRSLSDHEKEAFIFLKSELERIKDKSPVQEDIQYILYEVGKKYKFDLKLWFQALYEVLLGQSQGPRFGGFIAIYGIEQSIDLIDKAIDGKLCNV